MHELLMDLESEARGYGISPIEGGVGERIAYIIESYKVMDYWELVYYWYGNIRAMVEGSAELYL